MKKFWLKFKHWIIAIVSISLSFLVLNFIFNQPGPNNQTITTAEILPNKPYNSEILYSNSGPKETDDNFFIPGTFSNIDSLPEPNTTTIVWISAPWCQVCQTMRTFIWQSANTYKEQIAFKQIGFEDNYHSIILPNALFGTPTFLVFNKSGQWVDTFYGDDEDGFNKKLSEIKQIN